MYSFFYWALSRSIKTDPQGCGAGLADTKLIPFIDNTLFDTETQNTQVCTDHNDSLASYVNGT